MLMSRKSLIVPMTVAMHTKLKWAARREGKSMSRLMRGLIQAYLDGEVKVIGDGRLPKGASSTRISQPEPAAWAVYDEIAAKVDQALEGQ